MTAPALDYPSSPTLTTLRELIGEQAVLRLVAERGGPGIHVPMTADPGTELVRLIGPEAAEKVIKRFGGRTQLRIPTGKGHGHGRRLDHAEVVRLAGQGWSVQRLARAFACTDRQIFNILAKAGGRGEDPGQTRLL
jgi:uncharacterized protein (DUF433 family)